MQTHWQSRRPLAFQLRLLGRAEQAQAQLAEEMAQVEA